MLKRKTIIIFFDILIVTGSFLFFIWIKPATKRIYIPTYSGGFLVFLFLWIIASYLGDKYTLSKFFSIKKIYSNIFISNFFALAGVVMIMYISREFFYSRLVVIGTSLMATFFEIIISNIWYYYAHSPEVTTDIDLTKVEYSQLPVEEIKKLKKPKPHPVRELLPSEEINKIIIEECGAEIFNFISENIIVNHPRTLFLSTRTLLNIQKQPINYFENIINIAKLNDIRYINKFIEAINAKLPLGGIFIGCAETKEQRKKRILKKYPFIFNYIYYFFDFIFKRVFPKFYFTKKIYFFLTKGHNRVLSKAEILGRLYSCGFELIRGAEINKLYFFVVHKVRKPYFDTNPTYGPFIKLRRIGKNGQIIKVYKFRTMHPYSEYLQEYIYSRHNLDQGGKFKNDFRVSTLGRIMRKFWIDELPMLINLLKGQLKIVGVRPLSEHYFSLYNKELQKRRIKYKPGLIPPFYADLPKTLDEIMASEIKYLDQYDKHPLITDIKYFFKAIFNIFFRHARSK
jgi:lipopolysaccharide/colanic/teichoic acid biosynthesis glycosyltransferase